MNRCVRLRYRALAPLVPSIQYNHSVRSVVLYAPASAVPAFTPSPAAVIPLLRSAFSFLGLVPVAQGSSRLAIEVNVEAHGVRD